MDLFDTDDDWGASTVSRYAPERVHKLEGRIAELEAQLDVMSRNGQELYKLREALQKILDGSPPGDCWIRKSQIEAALEGGDE